MKATLTFIGHGSHKLNTSSGKVIYIDPFFPGDYSELCDILLITHNHSDHNAAEIVAKNKDSVVITPEIALKNGKYNSFDIGNIKITAVQAYNQNHSIDECVGYVVETDDIKIYFAGDTSKTEDMSEKLAELNLDYALLPIDGFYNMGPVEASECADLLNVRHVIPTHNDPNVIKSGQYSDKGIKEFFHKGKIVLKYGEKLCLD